MLVFDVEVGINSLDRIRSLDVWVGWNVLDSGLGVWVGWNVLDRAR